MLVVTVRARWTCCGKWGPTRASGTTPLDLVKNEGYCSWTRHLGSLTGTSPAQSFVACDSWAHLEGLLAMTALNTPEDVGACGASEQGSASSGISRHRHRLAHTASSELEDAVGGSSGSGAAEHGAEVVAEGVRSVDGAEAALSTVNGVRRTLVDEMMHARTVAANQGVSWLGCGE